MKITRFSILFALLLALAPVAFGDDVVLYNNLPNPLPPNLPSQAYEAQATSEFGGLIQLADGGSTYAQLEATVVLSDQSYLANWSSEINGTTITADGFTLPLTLTLYGVGANDSVGGVIATENLPNAFIPWRPDPTAGCGNGYLASDGLCHSGSLVPIDFSFTDITLPNQIIFGLAFNTTDYGAGATGVQGPYDSLNFALAETPPSVGSNPLPDTAYVNSTNPDDYGTDTGNIGSFGQGTGWSPYSPAVEFSTTPEPSPLLLLGTGLLVLAGICQRRSKVLVRSRLQKSLR
ncbi:MAG: PEP-CTERM sorting domain-containing protein [Terracidiphilus sp.]